MDLEKGNRRNIRIKEILKMEFLMESVLLILIMVIDLKAIIPKELEKGKAYMNMQKDLKYSGIFENGKMLGKGTFNFLIWK